MRELEQIRARHDEDWKWYKKYGYKHPDQVHPCQLDRAALISMVDELKAERDALESELAKNEKPFRDGSWDKATYMGAIRRRDEFLARDNAEIMALRKAIEDAIPMAEALTVEHAALRKYAQHRPWCNTQHPPRTHHCDCGLHKALGADK